MDEIRGKQAFELHKIISEAEIERRHLYAKIMYNLAEMHEKGLYKEFLGDESAEWAGYLAEIEVYFTRNQVKDFLRIHKRYTKEMGFAVLTYIEVPRSRLIDILPFVDSFHFLEWVEKAKVLTSKDWKIEVRQAKGLLTEEEEHECDMVGYEICSLCGKKHKKRDEENTEITT